MSEEIVTSGAEATAESSAPETSGELSTENIEASAEDGAIVESESSEELAEESLAQEDDAESLEAEDGAEVKAETPEELEQEIKEAVEDGATEEEVKSMIRKFTLKVNGKELVKEINLADEEGLKKELQMSYAGRQAMQELAELKKIYTNEIKRLVDNPFEVLSEIDPNFDPMSHVKGFVEKKYQESQLTPEQREAKAREDAYKKAMEENAKLKSEIEAARKQEELEKLEAEIEQDIVSAINEDPELELDEDTISLVAENLIWAEENGFTEMGAKDVIPTVKEQLREQFRRASSKFKSTAALKEYMGQDLLNKLREERIEQAKKQTTTVSNIKSKQVANPKKEEEKVERIPLSSLFK